MAYFTLPRRIATLLSMSAIVAACSPEGLVPPVGVDGETRVGAISPRGDIPANADSQWQPQQPMLPMATTESYSNNQTYLQDAAPTVTYGAPPSSLDAQHQQLSGAAQQSVPQGEGVNMDAMMGVEAPVVGLAQEQHSDISESTTSQPIVGNIGSDNPVALNDGYQARVNAYPQSSRVSANTQPQEVAMLRPESPVREPKMSPMPAVMPQSEVACRAELRRLGVGFKDVSAISNGPSCGINYPIELSGLASGIAIKPAVKLNCQVTLAFAKWVKFELNPSARFRYLSGVGRITPMGGYSCRKMNSRSSNPWSEHARGNAIDIGTITLKNGKKIDVRKKSIFSFREKGLLKAVRTDSCKYFSTVLGPGSDPQHWNHFHFDLRTRKSGYRHCD